MATKIRIFILFILFVSCKANKEQNVDSLEINNKILENEIIKYSHYIDSIEQHNPFIVCVFFNQVNDSTKQFGITSSIDASLFQYTPYHFKCNIQNREVFFTAVAGLDEKSWPYSNFFNLKKSAYLQVMQKHFPKDYEKYLDDIERMKRGVSCTEVEKFYDPLVCHLTFVHDKLIKKEIRGGLPY